MDPPIPFNDSRLLVISDIHHTHIIKGTIANSKGPLQSSCSECLELSSTLSSSSSKSDNDDSNIAHNKNNLAYQRSGSDNATESSPAEQFNDDSTEIMSASGCSYSSFYDAAIQDEYDNKNKNINKFGPEIGSAYIQEATRDGQCHTIFNAEMTAKEKPDNIHHRDIPFPLNSDRTLRAPISDNLARRAIQHGDGDSTHHSNNCTDDAISKLSSGYPMNYASSALPRSSSSSFSALSSLPQQKQKSFIQFVECKESSPVSPPSVPPTSDTKNQSPYQQNFPPTVNVVQSDCDNTKVMVATASNSSDAAIQSSFFLYHQMSSNGETRESLEQKKDDHTPVCSTWPSAADPLNNASSATDSNSSNDSDSSDSGTSNRCYRNRRSPNKGYRLNRQSRYRHERHHNFRLEDDAQVLKRRAIQVIVNLLDRTEPRGIVPSAKAACSRCMSHDYRNYKAMVPNYDTTNHATVTHSPGQSASCNARSEGPEQTMTLNKNMSLVSGLSIEDERFPARVGDWSVKQQISASSSTLSRHSTTDDVDNIKLHHEISPLLFGNVEATEDDELDLTLIGEEEELSAVVSPRLLLGQCHLAMRIDQQQPLMVIGQKLPGQLVDTYFSISDLGRYLIILMWIFGSKVVLEILAEVLTCPAVEYRTVSEDVALRRSYLVYEFIASYLGEGAQLFATSCRPTSCFGTFYPEHNAGRPATHLAQTPALCKEEIQSWQLWPLNIAGYYTPDGIWVEDENQELNGEDDSEADSFPGSPMHEGITLQGDFVSMASSLGDERSIQLLARIIMTEYSIPTKEILSLQDSTTRVLHRSNRTTRDQHRHYRMGKQHRAGQSSSGNRWTYLSQRTARVGKQRSRHDSSNAAEDDAGNNYSQEHPYYQHPSNDYFRYHQHCQNVAGSMTVFEFPPPSHSHEEDAYGGYADVENSWRTYPASHHHRPRRRERPRYNRKSINVKLLGCILRCVLEHKDAIVRILILGLRAISYQTTSSHGRHHTVHICRVLDTVFGLYNPSAFVAVLHQVDGVRCLSESLEQPGVADFLLRITSCSTSHAPLCLEPSLISYMAQLNWGEFLMSAATPAAVARRADRSMLAALTRWRATCGKRLVEQLRLSPIYSQFCHALFVTDSFSTTLDDVDNKRRRLHKLNNHRFTSSSASKLPSDNPDSYSRPSPVFSSSEQVGLIPSACMRYLLRRFSSHTTKVLDGLSWSSSTGSVVNDNITSQDEESNYQHQQLYPRQPEYTSSSSEFLASFCNGSSNPAGRSQFPGPRQNYSSSRSSIPLQKDITQTSNGSFHVTESRTTNLKNEFTERNIKSMLGESPAIVDPLQRSSSWMSLFGTEEKHHRFAATGLSKDQRQFLLSLVNLKIPLMELPHLSFQRRSKLYRFRGGANNSDTFALFAALVAQFGVWCFISDSFQWTGLLLLLIAARYLQKVSSTSRPPSCQTFKRSTRNSRHGSRLRSSSCPRSFPKTVPDDNDEPSSSISLTISRVAARSSSIGLISDPSLFSTSPAIHGSTGFWRSLESTINPNTLRNAVVQLSRGTRRMDSSPWSSRPDSVPNIPLDISAGEQRVCGPSPISHGSRTPDVEETESPSGLFLTLVLSQDCFCGYESCQTRQTFALILFALSHAMEEFNTRQLQNQQSFRSNRQCTSSSVVTTETVPELSSPISIATSTSPLNASFPEHCISVKDSPCLTLPPSSQFVTSVAKVFGLSRKSSFSCLQQQEQPSLLSVGGRSTLFVRESRTYVRSSAVVAPLIQLPDNHDVKSYFGCIPPQPATIAVARQPILASFRSVSDFLCRLLEGSAKPYIQCIDRLPKLEPSPNSQPAGPAGSWYPLSEWDIPLVPTGIDEGIFFSSDPTIYSDPLFELLKLIFARKGFLLALIEALRGPNNLIPAVELLSTLLQHMSPGKPLWRYSLYFNEVLCESALPRVCEAFIKEEISLSANEVNSSAILSYNQNPSTTKSVSRSVDWTASTLYDDKPVRSTVPIPLEMTKMTGSPQLFTAADNGPDITKSSTSPLNAAKSIAGCSTSVNQPPVKRHPRKVSTLLLQLLQCIKLITDLDPIGSLPTITSATWSILSTLFICSGAASILGARCFSLYRVVLEYGSVDVIYNAFISTSMVDKLITALTVAKKQEENLVSSPFDGEVASLVNLSLVLYRIYDSVLRNRSLYESETCTHDNNNNNSRGAKSSGVAATRCCSIDEEAKKENSSIDQVMSSRNSSACKSNKQKEHPLPNYCLEVAGAATETGGEPLDLIPSAANVVQEGHSIRSASRSVPRTTDNRSSGDSVVPVACCVDDITNPSPQPTGAVNESSSPTPLLVLGGVHLLSSSSSSSSLLSSFKPQNGVNCLEVLDAKSTDMSAAIALKEVSSAVGPHSSTEGMLSVMDINQESFPTTNCSGDNIEETELTGYEVRDELSEILCLEGQQLQSLAPLVDQRSSFYKAVDVAMVDSSDVVLSYSAFNKPSMICESFSKIVSVLTTEASSVSVSLEDDPVIPNVDSGWTSSHHGTSHGLPTVVQSNASAVDHLLHAAQPVPLGTTFSLSNGPAPCLSPYDVGSLDVDYFLNSNEDDGLRLTCSSEWNAKCANVERKQEDEYYEFLVGSYPIGDLMVRYVGQEPSTIVEEWKASLLDTTVNSSENLAYFSDANEPQQSYDDLSNVTDIPADNDHDDRSVIRSCPFIMQQEQAVSEDACEIMSFIPDTTEDYDDNDDDDDDDDDDDWTQCEIKDEAVGPKGVTRVNSHIQSDAENIDKDRRLVLDRFVLLYDHLEASTFWKELIPSLRIVEESRRISAITLAPLEETQKLRETRKKLLHLEKQQMLQTLALDEDGEDAENWIIPSSGVLDASRVCCSCPDSPMTCPNPSAQYSLKTMSVVVPDVSQILNDFLVADAIPRQQAQLWLETTDFEVVVTQLLSVIQSGHNDDIRGLAAVLLRSRLKSVRAFESSSFGKRIASELEAAGETTSTGSSESTTLDHHFEFIKNKLSPAILDLFVREQQPVVQQRIAAAIALCSEIYNAAGVKWDAIWSLISSWLAKDCSGSSEVRLAALNLLTCLAEDGSSLGLFDADSEALTAYLAAILESAEHATSFQEKESVFLVVAALDEGIYAANVGLHAVAKRLRSKPKAKPQFLSLKRQLRRLVPLMLRVLSDTLALAGNASNVVVNCDHLHRFLSSVAQICDADSGFWLGHILDLLNSTSRIAASRDVEFGLRRVALQVTCRASSGLMKRSAVDLAGGQSPANAQMLTEVVELVKNLVEVLIQQTTEKFEETEEEWLAHREDEPLDVADDTSMFGVTINMAEEFTISWSIHLHHGAVTSIHSAVFTVDSLKSSAALTSFWSFCYAAMASSNASSRPAADCHELTVTFLRKAAQLSVEQNPVAAVAGLRLLSSLLVESSIEGLEMDALDNLLDITLHLLVGPKRSECSRVRWWALVVMSELFSEQGPDLQRRHMRPVLVTVAGVVRDDPVIRCKCRALSALITFLSPLEEEVDGDTIAPLLEVLLSKVVTPAVTSDDDQLQELGFATASVLAEVSGTRFSLFYDNCVKAIFRILENAAFMRKTNAADPSTHFLLCEAVISLAQGICTAVGHEVCQKELPALCGEIINILEALPAAEAQIDSSTLSFSNIAKNALLTLAEMSGENFAPFCGRTAAVLSGILRQSDAAVVTSAFSSTRDGCAEPIVLAKMIAGRVDCSTTREGVTQVAVKDNIGGDDNMFEFKTKIIEEKVAALESIGSLVRICPEKWLQYHKEMCQLVATELRSTYRLIREAAHEASVGLMEMLLPGSEETDIARSQSSKLQLLEITSEVARARSSPVVSAMSIKLVSPFEFFATADVFISALLPQIEETASLEQAADILPTITTLLEALLDGYLINPAVRPTSPLPFLERLFTAFGKRMILTLTADITEVEEANQTGDSSTQEGSRTTDEEDEVEWEARSSDLDSDSSDDDYAGTVYTSVMQSVAYVQEVSSYFLLSLASQTFEEQCDDLFQRHLTTPFSALLTVPSVNMAGRTAGIFGMTNFVQYCGAGNKLSVTETVLPVVLLYAHCNIIPDVTTSGVFDEDVDRVQAACYAIGVLSQHAPSAVKAQFSAVVKTLLQVLAHGDAHAEERLAASSCSFGALLKIALNTEYRDALISEGFNTDALCQLIASWYPIGGDDHESCTVTKLLVDFILTRSETLEAQLKDQLRRSLVLMKAAIAENKDMIHKETRCTGKLDQAIAALSG